MSVAFVALLAVATLAAVVPQGTQATLITSLPGTWCDAAKKLRYDYSSIPHSWSAISIQGGASFYPFPERDDFTGSVHPLPFAFTFFGQTYTSAQMDSNGILGLAGDVALQPNYAYTPSMPNAATPNAVLAPFWFDLTFSDPGQMMFQNMGTYQVYYWQDGQVSPFYAPSAAANYPGYNFQARLYSDHHIEFHWKNVYDNQGITGNPAMMGIESAYDAANNWQGGIYRLMPAAAASGGAIKFVPVWDAAPTAAADTYSATQGTTLTVSGGTAPGAASSGVLYYIRTSGVMANDQDELYCASKTAQLVTGIPAGQGTLTLATDGGFTYNPGNFCGTTSFTYRVLDPAGSAGGSAFQSGTATVTLNVACLPNVDPTAQCSITTPAPRVAGQTIQFSSTGSSDSDGTIAAYEWTFTGGPATSAAASPSVSWATPGSYTATLRVRDDDGAWSQPVQCPITIDEPTQDPGNSPPIAGPKEYDVTAGITFQTSANAQGGLLSAASDPDPGTTLTFTQCAPPLAGLTLQSNGHFTWVAPSTPQVVTFQYKVSDGLLESACATVTINVVPNQRPAARFSATPNPVQVGETVFFMDLSTDPDPEDTITQWAWNFGDSQVSTQSSPSHAFGTVGSPLVCLIVTDNKGAQSFQTCNAIKVEPAAENPPPPSESAPIEGSGSNGGPVGGDDEEDPVSVTLDGPATAAPGETVTLTAHVVGGPAALTWFKLHGDATLTPSGTSVMFRVPEGADSIYIGVSASANGYVDEAAHLVTVREAGEGVAVAKIEGPQEALTGSSITLDGSLSVGATSFAWTQVDGPTAAITGAGTPRATVSFTQPGRATFLLTAGEASATHTVVVTEAAPTPDEPGLTGFSTRVDGHTVEVTPHVKAAKYVWSFGDGSPSQESDGPVTYTYQEDGTYDITMQVGAKQYIGSAQVEREDRAVPAAGESDASAGSPAVAIIVWAAVLLAAIAIVATVLVRRRRA